MLDSPTTPADVWPAAPEEGPEPVDVQREILKVLSEYGDSHVVRARCAELLRDLDGDGNEESS